MIELKAKMQSTKTGGVKRHHKEINTGRIPLHSLLP